MLATRKQITYLQDLTDRAEKIKREHPSLIPLGLYHKTWDIDMTSEDASLRISFYRSILDRCDMVLFPKRAKQVVENEDLPA